MGTVLSVLRLGDELPDVFGLVHQPVEGRHLILPLEFVADNLPNPCVVLVQPFFLREGGKSFHLSNCLRNWKLSNDSPREDLEDSGR